MRPDPRPQAAALASRPGKAAKPEKGPFEAHVETVTGKGLTIFGRDLFSDVHQPSRR